MWQEPIYDRTKYDVDLIKLDPTNKNNKGALNYYDLNRIENDCKFLSNLFNTCGLFNEKIDIQTKNNWERKDIPIIGDIDRIRKNILTIKNGMNLDVDDIEFSNTLDYVKVNILEKHLKLIRTVLDTHGKVFYRCNTFFCGSQGISSIYTKRREFYCGMIVCGMEVNL